ncbi:MAG: YceI family protein [Chitinophagaceae bacterium]|nr:MAG: YceI family protein [Chitinophagaceae bacterium]
MKKTILAAVLLMGIAGTAAAQTRYFTKSGRIQFTSKAPMEDIEAVNKTATAVLDIQSGALQFSVLMKGFEFEKALMQEHFNENYVESDKFPKAEFKGSVVNNGDIAYARPGSYPAKVKGKFTLHGVTREIETAGTITVGTDGIKAASGFTIQLSDYNVQIPSVVKEKISNSIRITVETKLDPLKG